MRGANAHREFSGKRENEKGFESLNEKEFAAYLGVGQILLCSCHDNTQNTNDNPECNPKAQRHRDESNESLALTPDVRKWAQDLNCSLLKKEYGLSWIGETIPCHRKLSRCDNRVSISEYPQQSATLNNCRDTQDGPNAHHQNWPEITHRKFAQQLLDIGFCGLSPFMRKPCCGRKDLSNKFFSLVMSYGLPSSKAANHGMPFQQTTGDRTRRKNGAIAAGERHQHIKNGIAQRSNDETEHANIKCVEPMHAGSLAGSGTMKKELS